MIREFSSELDVIRDFTTGVDIEARAVAGPSISHGFLNLGHLLKRNLDGGSFC